MSIFDSCTTPVSVVDIGASGGIHQRWRLLGENLRVIGFEPDERAFPNLPQGADTTWLNTALYAENETRLLYITRGQTNVSLLKPNFPVIDALSLDREGFEIERTVPLACERLDDVLQRVGMRADALKLDTQGSEFYILQGAEAVLSHTAFAVETEVMFVQIYEEQPLFTEIHRTLQAFGFCLMDYGNMAYLKWRHTAGRGGDKGVLVAADALYFKRLDQVDRIIPAGDVDALQRAIMISLVYGYVDYAIELCHATVRAGLLDASVSTSFIARLEGVRHYSRLVPDFPGRTKGVQGLGLLQKLFSKVDTAFFTNQLGNSTRWFRW